MKVKGAQNFCFSPSDIPDDHQSSYYWPSSILISFTHFSCSVMSDSLWPHGLQQARLPCQSPTPGAYSNLCPMVMPSKYLILCHPLLFPHSIFPSIRVFSNESIIHIRWPKNWSFSFIISPSNEYSGLISFRMDLSPCHPRDSQESSPHHSSKASILLCSAFFTVQLSHP